MFEKLIRQLLFMVVILRGGDYCRSAAGELMLSDLMELQTGVLSVRLRTIRAFEFRLHSAFVLSVPQQVRAVFVFFATIVRAKKPHDPCENCLVIYINIQSYTIRVTRT